MNALGFFKYGWFRSESAAVCCSKAIGEVRIVSILTTASRRGRRGPRIRSNHL